VHGAWRFLTLGARARRVRRRSIREFAHVYRMHARAFGWNAAAQRRHLDAARTFIEDFVAGAQRVAQFSRYERLFALWHVLHVPLVWMMLLSAVAHVVAVHAY
jgi:phage-related baseplate assembly protein